MAARTLSKLWRAAWPPPRWLWTLAGAGVLVAVLAISLALSGTLRGWTGEEEALPQLRGLFHLVADRLRPQPHVDPYLPVAHADVSPYGINTFLEQEVEPAKRELAMQMIADAGFEWIRQEFPWEDIEIHGKGDFEDRRQEPYVSAWAKYDSIVDLAGDYGVEIIARLGNPPAWSRADGNEGGTLAPPDDLEDYGDFVEAVVRRYRGRIHYYQIWNEPNIYPEWGSQPVDPEAYTELLRVAYTRAKAVDPDVVIICGALAATIENDLQRYGMSDFIFLQRMYDAGAGAYFDVLSMQGYGLWSGPYDRRMRPRVLDFSRPLYVRDLMVRNGDAAKPIWISEMNWNAIPPDHPAPPAYGRVTAEQQAEYVVEAYRRAQAEWPWLGVVNFWFFKRATDTEQNQSWYYFRMVEPDFTPLPAYDAVKQLTDEVPVLGLGAHQESHWALSYDGDWQTGSMDGAQIGSVMSSASGSLAFHWRGTDLSLRAAGPATVSVSIGGGTPRTVDVPSGLRDVALARQLADGEHEAKVVVLTGTLSVDNVTASRRLDARLPLAGLAVVAVAAVLIAVMRRRG
ncbi:MAG: cellulase family glycosylhydrolase [Anaerolineae bacterium]